MKSEYSQKLDKIIDLLGTNLQLLGFKKSSHVFNRRQPDGIIHVIHFQMGQSWSFLWGSFTVELGVFVPEIYEILHNGPVPRPVGSHLCIERERLGRLAYDGNDKWWDLASDETKIVNEISRILIEQNGIYFNKLSSREKLVAYWNKERGNESIHEHNVLYMAIMMAQNGEKTKAEELLKSEFSDRYKTSFLEISRNVCLSIGLEFPTLK